MSEPIIFANSEDELDAIINEVKEMAIEEESDITPTEEPEKTWSIDDIDKLINDEPLSDKKYDSILSSEFDSDIFSVRPIVEEKQKEEIEDISSIGDEVDGQESFFDEEEFDPMSFDLETVVIPDDDRVVYEDRKSEKTAEILKFDSPVTEPKKEEAKEPETDKESEEESQLDYKTRFFKRMHLEYTKEEEIVPEGPVEKSGFIVRKVDDDSQAEGDLDSVPTIVAAEDVKQQDEEKTRIIGIENRAPSDFVEGNDVEGQIVLNGFVDMPSEALPEESSENELEENLWQRRKQKAKAFKLEGIADDGFGEGFNEIEDEEENHMESIESDNDDDIEDDFSHASMEYTDSSERNAFYEKLGKKVKRSKKTLISIGIVSVIMILISIIPAIAERLSIETSIFVRDSAILCVAQAILLISAVAIDSERFFDSLTGMFKGEFYGSTVVSLSLALALVENTIAAILDFSTPVFSAVAVLGVLILKATDLIDAKRIYGNFSICGFNYEHNMYAVHPFDNESEVFELGRGLLMGNAEMLYSSNVTFPADFMKKSKENIENSKYVKIALIISTLCSVIGAAIVGIKTGQFITAFSVFTGCFCLSAPVTSSYVPAFITRVANYKLNSEGTMIVSLDEAEKIAAANAVVIDSADIFDRDKCTMHGMKEFHTLRTDAVLLYASAMVIKSGGPLKECFEKVVDGRQDLLPPVRELVYEDKMGISARIYDQKVLLGNRNMLIHHNIKAPDKEIENKYLHDGHKVIYLACNEKLAALFVVSYSADDNMKSQLKKLENNGIQVLVRTNDVNVTEELISDSYGISSDNFKILSSVAGRLYKRRKDTVSDSLSVGVIHDGKAISMIKAIATSCSMSTGMKFGRIIISLLSVLALVVGIAAACMGEFGLTQAIAVCLMLLEMAITSGTLLLINR